MEWFFLGLALLLVLANGFFVATEFAIVKVRGSRLQTMAEEGIPGAGTALKMSQQLDAYLSATQFGITLASLALGWIGEPAFAHLLEPLFVRVLPDPSAAAGLAHKVAVPVAFAIITFLHIVVGELAPKSLAIQKAEATTLAVALPMRVFYVLFYPGIWLLNGVAGRLLKLFGLTTAGEAHEAHSADELKVILHSSAQAGAITEYRANLLSRALEMVEKTARQVLVPRNQVRFLDLEEPLEKSIAEARAAGHTWLPVARENLDQVEGVVNVKDLYYLLSRGELRSLAQVQRPVLFVPENVTLEQLLKEFRRRRRQLAVVVDEHGGTSGIVTLADVVAEVVGDVAELGRKVDEVKTLPGGRLEIPGTAQLDDLSDRLDVEFELPDLEEGEVTTVGGYLMARLGRIPQVGDSVAVEQWEVRVLEVEGPRVRTVSVSPRVPVATAVVTPS
ncbi:MAG: hemolysin family protein [Myxococcaceae bacterium]|nr:hemolysin family protein [Myxococcaceae bacterium]MCI0669653.1 hemolysin family protein [Myxococcaceae bacterium]